MVTQEQFSQKHHSKSDWYFLSPFLSGTVGAILGLMIANFLGWV